MEEKGAPTELAGDATHLEDAWRRLTGYRPDQTYEWNFDRPPTPVSLQAATMPGTWSFCGFTVDSPIGVPAGPLLNGDWCLYYASLGFDVLTYKTVRSATRACYPPPNVQPVICDALSGGERDLLASDRMEGSWAVSYGMPSKSPEFWRGDIRRTRDRLPPNKLLVVSTVGTVQEGWSVHDLAENYADCAEWALESGADAVELNFSCPNVSTCDGQLYQTPDSAKQVASIVRSRIGAEPALIVKIGHLRSDDAVEPLVAALADSVTAIAATNSIASTVVDSQGEQMFNGQVRGICGSAILDASIRQIASLRQTIDRLGLGIDLIGVGGAATAADVRRYLDAGAQSVHVATAAMVRPWTALQIRKDWAR